MKLQARLLGISIIMTFVTTISCKVCTTNIDCKYGTCNAVLKICTCSLACDLFGVSKLVCANKRMPMRECHALNLACETQENIPLNPFNLTLFRRHKNNCKKIPAAVPHEEFCTDQTFCSGNGICLQLAGMKEKYCRCNGKYIGDRCNVKKPLLLESSSSSVRRPLDIGLIESPNIMTDYYRTIDPAPYVALGIISIAVFVCLLYYMRKRSSKAHFHSGNNGEKNDMDDSSKDTLRVSQHRDDKTMKQFSTLKEIKVKEIRESKVGKHNIANVTTAEKSTMKMTGTSIISSFKCDAQVELPDISSGESLYHANHKSTSMKQAESEPDDEYLV